MKDVTRDCEVDDLTVDAEVCGEVVEVEDSDGKKIFVATKFREPHSKELFCNNCGEYLEFGQEEIKKHLLAE